VVRRHLVALMRLALHRVGPAEFPTDAELERWVAAHADTFAVAPRVRLTHVYLGRDRRGAALEHDAEALLAELQQEGVGPDTAARYGDAFVRGADVGPASSGDVDRIFGPGFAAAITDAPVGRWVGPVRSTYGLHLVWIREREAGGLPPLAAVRGRALHGWLVERGAQRAEERMAALRSRYDVDVEEP